MYTINGQWYTINSVFVFCPTPAGGRSLCSGIAGRLNWFCRISCYWGADKLWLSRRMLPFSGSLRHNSLV